MNPFEALDGLIATAPPEARAGIAVALAARLATVATGLMESALAPRSTPEPSEPEERVFTYAQAAEFLGVRKSYVETMVREHRIPFLPLPGTAKAGAVRQGKQKRILRSSLVAYLKSIEQQSVGR